MSNYSKAAGILSIISGAWGGLLVLGYGLLALAFTFFPVSKGGGAAAAQPGVIMAIVIAVIGFFVALVSALAIVGGVYTLQKRHWGVAVAGAVGGAFVMFATGIVAAILVGLARPEFRKIEDVSSATELGAQGVGEARQPSKRAVIAGILTIVAGSLGIIGGIMRTIAMNFFLTSDLFRSLYGGQMAPFMMNYLSYMSLYSLAWAIAASVAGILAIIGGVYALKRKKWKLSLAGTIAAAIAFWPCGIPAVFLLAYSSDEFESDTKRDSASSWLAR